MNRYKVLRPIAYSGRREIGELLDLEPEVAANIGPDYLELVDVPKEAVTDQGQGDEGKGSGEGELTVEVIDGMKKPEVIEALKKLEVAFDEAAKVADLRELLKASLAGQGDEGKV